MAKKKYSEYDSIEDLKRETGYNTIFDLNNELQKKIKEQLTPKKIEQLEKIKFEREKALQHNKQIRKHKKQKLKELEKEISEMSTSQIQKDFDKLEKRRKRIEIDADRHIIPIRQLYTNKANKIAGDDFDFVVSDNHTKKVYHIRASTLVSKKDPALYLAQVWRREVKKIRKEIEEREPSTYRRGIDGKIGHIAATDKLIRKFNDVIHTLKTGEEIEDYEVINGARKRVTPPFIMMEMTDETINLFW